MLRGYRKRAFRAFLDACPEPLGAQLHYLNLHGRWPDFRHPRRFSELVFAQMLYGDHAAFADLADKVRVKDYVTARLGASWVIPTIWHGPALPSRPLRDWPVPFVLKANTGSGRNVFVRSASEADWDRIEALVDRWTGEPWPKWKHEDWYNLVEPQLLVEPMIGDGSGDLPDYKVFVFAGRAHLVQVDTDRFGAHARAFYDRDWIRQPFTFNPKIPVSPGLHPRPLDLDGILRAAEALGEGFDFVRVDFYDLPEGPRFGEMTFSPAAGMETFRPDPYDLSWGQVWREEVAAKGAGSPPPGRAPARPMPRAARGGLPG